MYLKAEVTLVCLIIAKMSLLKALQNQKHYILLSLFTKHLIRQGCLPVSRKTGSEYNIKELL